MKSPRRLLIGFLAAMSLVPPASAAPALAQALEQAWLRHPQARALDARESEARAEQDLARGWTPEPGALSISSRNDRFNRNQGQQEYEVELAAPLWLPGQRAAREEAASGQAAEVAARRDALRLELAGNLRDAWWSLAAARNAAALAQRRVDTARGLAADVLRRYKAGDLSRMDANLARSELSAAQSEQVESDTALKVAEQTYALLVAAPPPAQLDEEVVAPATATAQAHPQLALAAASAASARGRLKAARAASRAAPEIALRMVRDRSDFTSSYADSVGVKLTIPFSLAARVRRDNAAATAEAEQAEAEMLAARTKVALEQERARGALAAAESQLAMAHERQMLSTDNLRLAEKAFALGETDLSALLRIRAAAHDADAALYRQRVARAAAVSRLNQAMGVLP